MLLVNGLLLLVGALMTTGEAILILGPILAPLAAAYGYDKVIFGIIMIVNLEIGFLTPPVGLNLLVAMTTFKQKFGELVHRRRAFHPDHAGLPGVDRLAALDFHGAGEALSHHAIALSPFSSATTLVRALRQRKVSAVRVAGGLPGTAWTGSIRMVNAVVVQDRRAAGLQARKADEAAARGEWLGPCTDCP